MGVYYQPSSYHRDQRSQQQQQQQYKQQQMREKVVAVVKFVGVNLLTGIPLVFLFSFTIPLWSLATSTIGFAIMTFVVSRKESISMWRGTFYSIIVFTLTNTIGILLFGGGGMLAVFQSLAITTGLTVIFMIIGPARRLLLFFARNVVGRWIGYAVTVTGLGMVVSTVFAIDSPILPTVAESLQKDLNTLSQTLPQKSAQMSNAIIVHPFVSNGRAYLYASLNGNGKILQIPTKSYTSYYNRIVALLTRTPLNADALLSTGSGVVREVLQANAFLPSVDNPIVIADGSLNQVNYNAEFSSRIVFRSVSTNIAQIQQNIGRVFETSVISPQNTRIINGVPENEEGLTKLEVDGNWSDWSSIHPRWQSVISKYGYAENAGKTSADVLNAIDSGSNVMIIVAHGDGSQIFFPDGSRLRIQDFSALQEQIQKNNPLVILFSCEAGKIQGLNSYAKSLIDLGARAVVAPTTEIGAKSSSSLLDSFLEKSASGLHALEALLKAAESTGIFDMENWIGHAMPNEFIIMFSQRNSHVIG